MKTSWIRFGWAAALAVVCPMAQAAEGGVPADKSTMSPLPAVAPVSPAVYQKWLQDQLARTGNLFRNGDFALTNRPFVGWNTDFSLPGADGKSTIPGGGNWGANFPLGSDFYKDNAKKVFIESKAGGGNMLAIKASKGDAGGQGVVADSDPVPYDPNARYRLTVTARTTTSDARILLEGYHWKAGIRPHPEPSLPELRKCYRWSKVYFGSNKFGDFSGVGKGWRTATMTVEPLKSSDTELKREHQEKVRFMVLHIIALGGGGDWNNFNSPGNGLLIGEARLEKGSY